MTDLHADRTKSPYFRRYALRAFLTIMEPNFKFCCILLSTNIGNHTIQFTGWCKRQFMRFFDKFCLYMNEICRWLNLKPKIQTEGRFCVSGGVQGSRFELGGFKGEEETFTNQPAFSLHYKRL